MKIRLAPQQLRTKLQVVVAVQHLRQPLQQAEHRGGELGWSAHRCGTRGRVWQRAPQPAVQRFSAQHLQPPARQRLLAGGVGESQHLAVAGTQLLCRERHLGLSCRADHAIGAVIQQQERPFRGINVLRRPGL